MLIARYIKLINQVDSNAEINPEEPSENEIDDVIKTINPNIIPIKILICALRFRILQIPKYVAKKIIATNSKT